MSAIARDEAYPPGSLGAEVQRACDEADKAYPGVGDVLLAEWNAAWVRMQADGLRRAWEATS